MDWRLHNRWAEPFVVASHLRRVKSGLDGFIGLVGAVGWVLETSAPVTLNDGAETVIGDLSVSAHEPRLADVDTLEIEIHLKRPLWKRERRSVHRQIDPVRLRLRGLALGTGEWQVPKAAKLKLHARWTASHLLDPKLSYEKRARELQLDGHDVSSDAIRKAVSRFAKASGLTLQ